MKKLLFTIFILGLSIHTIAQNRISLGGGAAIVNNSSFEQINGFSFSVLATFPKKHKNWAIQTGLETFTSVYYTDMLKVPLKFQYYFLEDKLFSGAGLAYNHVMSDLAIETGASMDMVYEVGYRLKLGNRWAIIPKLSYWHNVTPIEIAEIKYEFNFWNIGLHIEFY